MNDQSTNLVIKPPQPLAERRWWRRIPWRFVAVLAVLGASYLVASVTGFADQLTVESVRELIGGAGVWGMLLFVGAFALGLFMHVPGMVFVAVAVLAYGQVGGGLIGLIGALFAVSVSFWVVRLIGGTPSATIKQKWLRRVFDKLESRPVLTVATLRLFMFLSPPVNYALAMSRIRFRDYLLGSALGLLVPFVATSLFLDCVLSL